MNTLRELDSAERDAKKKTTLVYISCFQRQVLTRLKDISKKKMSELLKTTNHSRNQTYFVINFFKLVEMNNKLMYSKLPIRFFKRNFKTIKAICDEEPDLFT